MAANREIERKFLVSSMQWKEGAVPVHMVQGYLNSDYRRTVRVRVVGDKAWITVKGPNRGISRAEYEYEIDAGQAMEMLRDLCEQPVIEKNRYRVEHAGLVWEIDEFKGANDGLVVAEVELESEGQEIEVPEWIGEEVSGDPKYYNNSLIARPYSTWK